MRYDAGEFLRSLFDDDLPPGPPALPPDWHEWWDERAAILEYDAGVPREHAEAAALKMVHEEMRREEDCKEAARQREAVRQWAAECGSEKRGYSTGP